jgi:hypothetical protein
MKLKQYLNEAKVKEPNLDKLVNEMFNWSMHNKKFSTFNKMYAEVFGYHRNLKDYVSAGGKAWGQKWSDILSQHITDEAENNIYFYAKKDSLKLWNQFSKKVKITLDDLEQFAKKWNRTIY